MSLTREQVDALLQPIAGARVSQKQGMSHVEAYDVRRRLIELFGFGGWSGDVTEAHLLYEQLSEDGKKVSVGYRVVYRLAVDGATYTEAACGDATNFPINKRGDAHDFAVKTAESQGLKRCAVNLGDQFGLSLYNNGSLAPLVKFVLGNDPAALTQEHNGRAFTVKRPERAEDADASDHVTEPLAPETPAPGGEEAPPAPESPPAQAQKSTAPDYERALAESRRSEPEEPPEVNHEMEDGIAREADTVLTSDRDVRAKKAALTKLLVKANTEGVRKAYVAGEGGEAVTLEAYIQRCIAEVGR